MATHTIREIRLLPPFAIGRLGSSPQPMDNYELEMDNAIAYRRIVPSETLLLDQDTGEISSCHLPAAPVRFRDDQDRIKPVAPFLEIWALLDENDRLEPLTAEHLADIGLLPSDVIWKVHAANIKAFRRTRDPNDQIHAITGEIRDHALHPLVGKCANFLPGKSIPFGTVRYVKPTADFPELRFRFTPAVGKVYRPAPQPDDNPGVLPQLEAVYDPSKPWRGYTDPATNTTTNPSGIFGGYDTGPSSQPIHHSYGYLDDECDGIIDVRIDIPAGPAAAPRSLQAFARITAGPPTFAPDSLPVRTVFDELLQALEGPDYQGVPTRAEAEAIVRRALDSVRLMNTQFLNSINGGMARMDNNDVQRASEPIFDPAVVDALAIRARHERVLLGLTGDTLAWFARTLRNYDEIGDLTNEGRRKMPGMMRGADARHVALTRRTVSLIQAAALELTGAHLDGEDNGNA